MIYTIDFSSVLQLSDQQFEEICHANPELKFERTPTGELVIMPPTGGETGSHNATLTARFVVWNETVNLGKVFDSSTCFRLPKGGERSPDVAWIERSRWDELTLEQKRKFPPICPDFVLELRSPSDNLRTLQAKMQEYLDNGAQIGWLINPPDQTVEVYQHGRSPDILSSPTQLNGDPVLPEFQLDLSWLWIGEG